MCWAITAMTRPPYGTGIAAARPDRVGRERRDDPALAQRLVDDRPATAREEGATRSSVKTVGPVVGRSWAAAT